MTPVAFIIPMLKLIFILALAGGVAHAQNDLIFRPDERETAPAVRPHVVFDVIDLNYTSTSDHDHSNQQKFEIEVGHEQQGFLLSKSQLVVGTFSEPKSFYFAVPELYVGGGTAEKNFLAAGRLKKNFNFLDSYYNVGLFNSFFTNDYIDYREQGLTGLHAQYFDGFFGVYAAMTPYSFPNQGPQVHEESGGLASSNRFAPRPPPQFEFADRHHPIEYAIRDYKLSEIIENQGQAATIFMGPNVKRPLAQLSYAHQPLNEIPLMRETYGGAMDFVGHVKLSPVVTYHEVKSADVNLDYRNIQTTLSYAEDQVRNKTAAENESLQYLSPLKIYGVYLAADFSSFAHRELTLSVAVAEMSGGEIKDLTSEGQAGLFTLANQRTQFKSPLTLGAATELMFVNAKPLRSQLRWTYDRRAKGTLASLELSYEAISKMFVRLGVDVIGVEESLPDDVPRNFSDQNQSNDRVYGGLQYAF